MSHPYDHSRSSARRYGGVPDDYLAIHNWFDESKKFYAHWRHRALRHHAEGIFMAERIFGVCIKTSEGRNVPVRSVRIRIMRYPHFWRPFMSNLTDGTDRNQCIIDLNTGKLESLRKYVESDFWPRHRGLDQPVLLILREPDGRWEACDVFLAAN